MKPLALTVAFLTAVAWSSPTTLPPNQPARAASVVEAELVAPVTPVAANGIVAKDRYDVGEPITISCEVAAPEGGLVARRWFGEGVRIRRIGDGAKVHVWGSAGQKAIECVVATYSDGKLAVAKYRAKFLIGDPVPPKPLNELVDAATAKALATYCRLWCEPSVLATVATGEALRDAFAVQGTARSLTANDAWPVIVARVAKAAPDGPLNATAVTAVLVATADELAAAPAPQPGPQPPTPDPTPAPIQYPGFHVLVIEEQTIRGDNPPPSSTLLSYVRGKGGEIRFIDDDQKPDLLAEFYQSAWKLPRASSPWVVIAKESQGYSGPWPKSDADRLALLKKYGGE